MALKIGLVGMGGIGNTHADAYVKDELANLAAVCDVKRELADAAAAKYGVPAFYTLQDMLKAMPELDMIDVTTSGYEQGSWHYVPVMEALTAGKNVLCEKPMSNDVREAREMVALAAQKQLYLGCNLNHYFTKTADHADQLIKDGKIGEPVYMIHKMGFNGGQSDYKGPGSLRWQRPYSHMKAFLAHPFSVMRHFGGDITHIQAFLSKPGVRQTANDVMLSINSVHVKFANGSSGYLLSQRGDAMFGLGGWWSLEMAGTKGTFVIENCVEKISFWDAGQPKNSLSAPAPTEVYETGITDFGATFPVRLHAFLEDVTNQVSPDLIRASGRDALATIEYMYAVIRSYEEGGIVVRPEPLPNLHGDIFKTI
ncbi:MAG TPA: oxidoreductase [Clostridiales bacterium]|nr:oxidoreductase [Clostridiales bacterium]